MTPKCQTISTDVALQLVASQRRRLVLTQLINNGDGRVSIPELITGMRESRPERIGDAEVEAMTTSLYHNHLPKLDVHGVIDYDPHGGTVAYRPSPTIEALLRFVTEELT